MYFPGLSQHHDSAAALLLDGQIVAFCEEERFGRIKHDGGFPALAVRPACHSTIARPDPRTDQSTRHADTNATVARHRQPRVGPDQQHRHRSILAAVTAGA
jgi:predicted NodU family carbamoyl transferase